MNRAGLAQRQSPGKCGLWVRGALLLSSARDHSCRLAPAPALTQPSPQERAPSSSFMPHCPDAMGSCHLSPVPWSECPGGPPAPHPPAWAGRAGGGQEELPVVPAVRTLGPWRSLLRLTLSPPAAARAGPPFSPARLTQRSQGKASPCRMNGRHQAWKDRGPFNRAGHLSARMASKLLGHWDGLWGGRQASRRGQVGGVPGRVAKPSSVTLGAPAGPGSSVLHGKGSERRRPWPEPHRGSLSWGTQAGFWEEEE